MARSFARFLMLMVALVGIAGCTTPVPDRPRLQLSFSHLPPIRLDVASVEVVSRFTASAQAPHVEYEMPMSPQAMLETWARDRLHAVGAQGVARLIIHDASVTHEKLAVDRSFKGVFKEEQSDRYSGAVEATVELVDGLGRSLGYATASATRVRTLGEDATLNEREQSLFELGETMVKDFDGQMERAIRRHLAGYLR